MAQVHQRIFAFVLALLFLLASLGSAVAVYLTMREDDKQQREAQQALQSATQQAKETKKEGALEGTKLANFTPVEKVEGLQSQDLVAGTGEEVKAGATITAHYTGALAKDGTIFQSSLDTGEPATFGLDQVIRGWTDGVPGMKVGGKRRLVIPAAMAYGDRSPAANIPANSDLVFDIELVSIGAAAQ